MKQLTLYPERISEGASPGNGGSEVLRLEAIATPTLADSEVLVRVHGASVNPLDWHFVRGKP